jgi:DNA repair protein RadA/Sms
MKNDSMNLNLASTKFINVDNVEIPDIYYRRIKTGIKRIDDTFGSGFLPGSIFTLTGSPGAGKTTYLLQVLHEIRKRGYDVGYASGEECVEMLACNCRRLGVSNIQISNETNIDELIKYTKDLDVLIIDSFASTTSDIKSSRAHEKHCIQELCKAAKVNECVVGIILHISKTGQYKGGTIIPHTVDAVAHLEREMLDGQPDNHVTLNVSKNRFGPTGQMTLLMTAQGYDWNYTNEGQIQGIKTEESVPKNTKKAREVAILLQQDKVNVIEAQQLIDCDSQRCRYLLNQLARQGKMKKVNTGPDATFEKI